MKPIRLDQTFLQLVDGPEARPVPVGPDFWETLPRRPELHAGRMITRSRTQGSWGYWEMHPAGDEVLVILDGAVDLVLETPTGETHVAAAAPDCVVIPQGVWHRVESPDGCEILFITRGEGTQHKPR